MRKDDKANDLDRKGVGSTEDARYGYDDSGRAAPVGNIIRRLWAAWRFQANSESTGPSEMDATMPSAYGDMEVDEDLIYKKAKGCPSYAMKTEPGRFGSEGLVGTDRQDMAPPFRRASFPGAYPVAGSIHLMAMENGVQSNDGESRSSSRVSEILVQASLVNSNGRRAADGLVVDAILHSTVTTHPKDTIIVDKRKLLACGVILVLLNVALAIALGVALMHEPPSQGENYYSTLNDNSSTALGSTIVSPTISPSSSFEPGSAQTSTPSDETNMSTLPPLDIQASQPPTTPKASPTGSFQPTAMLWTPSSTPSTLDIQSTQPTPPQQLPLTRSPTVSFRPTVILGTSSPTANPSNKPSPPEGRYFSISANPTVSQNPSDSQNPTPEGDGRDRKDKEEERSDSDDGRSRKRKAGSGEDHFLFHVRL